MIYMDNFISPIGEITFFATDNGLINIALPGKSEESKHWCYQKLRDDQFKLSSSYFKDVSTQFSEYFLGKRSVFQLSSILITSPFRQKSLEAVSQIPYGETRSYSEIAILAGNPRAIRAAATANATNPLAIVIPCHRVIAQDGSLGGYGGGFEMKQWLLEHEKSYA